ncbi:uncharacterized protein BJ171DRAFT_278877 [Polychytrium aggregatum]|uniref:uncharacterized protein n=1 Tax=Polychytrium aggregatum TaxID=110093 RepID=UPI0022FE9799|nr:uncharacterized protein BJ171DRAFT_278877 [Polychytrium aggregatum]KAI9207646.1 hypothetical protein BJ171DRAFT_278877 [Polychytrium aggregatum]
MATPSPRGRPSSAAPWESKRMPKQRLLMCRAGFMSGPSVRGPGRSRRPDPPTTPINPTWTSGLAQRSAGLPFASASGVCPPSSIHSHSCPSEPSPSTFCCIQCTFNTKEEDRFTPVSLWLLLEALVAYVRLPKAILYYFLYRNPAQLNMNSHRLFRNYSLLLYQAALCSWVWGALIIVKEQVLWPPYLDMRIMTVEILFGAAVWVLISIGGASIVLSSALCPGLQVPAGIRAYIEQMATIFSGAVVIDPHNIRRWSIVQSGLTTQEVATLPVLHYSASSDTESAVERMCPICLMDLEEGEAVRELTCGHLFHPECIDPWLLGPSPSTIPHTRSVYGHRTCPICKQDALAGIVYGRRHVRLPFVGPAFLFPDRSGTRSQTSSLLPSASSSARVSRNPSYQTLYP